MLHNGALLNIINPATFKKIPSTVYLQAVLSSPNQLVSFIQSQPAIIFSSQSPVSCHKSKMLSPLLVCCYYRAEDILQSTNIWNQSINQKSPFKNSPISVHHHTTRPLGALVCQTTLLGVVLCVQLAHRTVLSRLHKKSIFQIIFLIRFSCLRNLQYIRSSEPPRTPLY